MQATVSGRRFFLGSLKAALNLGAKVPVRSSPKQDAVAINRSESVLLDLDLQVIQARFEFEDEIRPEAADVIGSLRKLGTEHLVILSGDRSAPVEALGRALKMDAVYAEQSPEQKSKLIQELKARFGAVAMIGDGINDSIALAQADLSLSLSGASELAQNTAQMTLMNGTLTQLPAGLTLAHRTHRVLKQNLFWAFGYNLIAIPIAASGELSPMIAGAAMAMSSLCVVINSLRLTVPKN